MDDLEARMQRVLGTARESMTPSDADRARLRRAVLAATAGALVGVGAGKAAAAAVGAGKAAAVGQVATSQASGVLASLAGLSVGAKTAAVAVVLSTALGTAGIVVTQNEPAARSQTVAAQNRAVASPPAAQELMAPDLVTSLPQESPAVLSVDKPEATAAPRPVSPTALKPITPDPLTAELTLIEKARKALQAGDPQGALALLSEHQARFAQGVMVQERTAMRALALCALGDPRGKQEAEQFLLQTPGSPLAAHLRAGCK